MIVATDLNAENDKLLKTKTTSDMLGRPVLTESTEDGTNYTISVKNAYLNMGQVTLTSSPMRSTASSTDSWTRVTKDTVGRVVEAATFGGAAQPAWIGTAGAFTGAVTTAYTANFTTVTDQAGKVRRSMADALGRLTRVDEPDGSGNLGSTAAPVQPTSYAYNVFDNLTTVNQGEQTRTFTYDSLSRLRSAVNPESGTISYQYDDNGNLIVKTDARTDPNNPNKKVSAHYAYDALNRVTRRWYNGSNSPSAAIHNEPTLPPGVGATDEVKFYYDTQVLPGSAPSYTRGSAVGRLVAQTYGTGSNGDYYAYDVLGRPTLKFQQTGTVNYKLEAAYTLSGAVSSLIYPSNNTVTNTFDQAGRLINFSGNLGGETRTYASGNVYSPVGGLLKEQFGTNTAVYHKLHYNSSRQICDVRASNVNDEWGGELGALANYYSTPYAHCGNGANNNGNLLMSQTIINSVFFEDRYTYDSLNRLTAVSEYLNGTTPSGTQEYDYDRWGNRTIKLSSTLGSNKQFTVIPAKNRLGVPTGQIGVMQYDDAGNLTTDTYTGAGNRTYDAENKMISAMGGISPQPQLYKYDGSGQRIKRTVDGVETWQVYGFGGELIAEYGANGAAASPQKEYGYRNGQLLITATPVNDRSLSLNGSSAYAQVPNSSSLNITGAITVEAWVKVNAIGVYQDIVTRESYGQAGTGGGYGLTVTNLGKPRMDLYHTPTTYTPVIGNSTMSTGVWHHVAGVWDGTYLRIYLNGVLDGTVTTGNGPGAGTSSLKIGRNSGGGYFNGLIDELRVSNTAVYSSTFTPPTHLTASSSTKGLWKFDGPTTNDTSGNGNNGSLQGGAVFATDVPTGPAYHSGSFNGSSAYVQVPNSSSLNITGAITVEAWIKLSSIGVYQDIVTRESYGQAGTGGGYGLTVTNLGKPRIDLYHSPTQYTPVIGNTTMSTGVWHHVAGVWDGTYLRIYLNGVLDGTVTTGNGPGTGTSSVKIGRNSGGGYFNGLIDELRLSNTAVYTSNFTPQEHLTASGNTKGLWKFDSQSPNDASANGNHGTLQGGATYSNDVPGVGGGGGGAGVGPHIQWLVSDHLGTPRMVFDQTATLANVKRHDYLPFGEELFAPIGGRDPALGYASGDGVRQQFTSKERDVETGLDYFLARYYSGVHGRFTSPDEFKGGAYEFWLLGDPSTGEKQALPFGDIRLPQSLNKYQYCYNNPLKFVDPNGHDALYIENKDTGKTTIVIPVHFTGPSATPGLISEVISRASKLDTGNPNVTIEVVATDKPMHGVLNTMNLSPDLEKKYSKGEGVNELGGNKGHIRTNGVGQGGAIVHETLHFAGLKDRYKEGFTLGRRRKRATPVKGYDNSNIMTASGGTTLKPEQIVEAKKNDSTKKCTTENGVTKCK